MLTQTQLIRLPPKFGPRKRGCKTALAYTLLALVEVVVYHVFSINFGGLISFIFNETIKITNPTECPPHKIHQEALVTAPIPLLLRRMRNLFRYHRTGSICSRPTCRQMQLTRVSKTGGRRGSAAGTRCPSSFRRCHDERPSISSEVFFPISDASKLSR